MGECVYYSCQRKSSCWALFSFNAKKKFLELSSAEEWFEWVAMLIIIITFYYEGNVVYVISMLLYRLLVVGVGGGMGSF